MKVDPIYTAIKKNINMLSAKWRPLCLGLDVINVALHMSGHSTVEVLHFVLMTYWAQHGTNRFVTLETQYLYLQLNVSHIYSQGPMLVTKSSIDADVVASNRNQGLSILHKTS